MSVRLSGSVAVVCALALSSCSPGVHGVLEELERLPAADFSYIQHPEFVGEEAELESRIKEMMSAEGVDVRATGMHRVDEDSGGQGDERYWLKVVVLNPAELSDLSDDEEVRVPGKTVAKETMSGISNIDVYEKIQVTFVREREETVRIVERRHLFYSLPELDVIQF